MGKKQKQLKTSAQAPDSPLEPLSRRGKRVVARGLGTLVLGFIALSFTDPMGRNAASLVAPFLIVGGYVLIGAGIFLPDAPPATGPSQNPSAPPSRIL